MKRKPTKSKRGRKRFSAGKLISPDKDLEENLALAVGGEFAIADQPEDRAIFSLVGLWKSYYAPAFAEANDASQSAKIKRERFTKWFSKSSSPHLTGWTPNRLKLSFASSHSCRTRNEVACYCLIFAKFCASPMK